jgi:hypothetical protein
MKEDEKSKAFGMNGEARNEYKIVYRKWEGETWVYMGG